MLRSILIWLLVLSALVILIASCTLPEDTCGPDDLVAPAGFSPVWEIVPTFEPMLVWTYSSDCVADEFVVELSTGGSFLPSETRSGTTTGEITNWTFPVPLNPVTEYFWRVAAFKDGIRGPNSDTETFYTGPLCDPASLLSPSIVDPENWGVETTAAWQALVWEYPDTSCIPEYYEAQLRPAADTTFSGPNLMDVPTSGPPITRQIPMELLDDCTGYIWRVRAVVAGRNGPWSETARFHTDYAGACGEESIYDFFPTCPTADLVSPLPIYPYPFAVVEDLIPSFSWEYPDLCLPEGYSIDVTTFGDYSEGTISGGTGNPSNSWTPAAALEPATKYEWRVAPINGSTLGAYSTSTWFWTGPYCLTSDLVSPSLEYPANAHEVHEPTPTLSWNYPDGCIPESFEWYLSTDRSFTTYDLFIDTSIPADAITLVDPLLDCTIYFWRVRATNSGGSGPFSTTFNFYTNFDHTCPSVAPPPPAETTCPAGQVVNPTTGDCEPIACSSVTDQSTCESLSHCYWENKNGECRE